MSRLDLMLFTQMLVSCCQSVCRFIQRHRFITIFTNRPVAYKHNDDYSELVSNNLIINCYLYKYQCIDRVASTLTLYYSANNLEFTDHHVGKLYMTGGVISHS